MEEYLRPLQCRSVLIVAQLEGLGKVLGGEQQVVGLVDGAFQVVGDAEEVSTQGNAERAAESHVLVGAICEVTQLLLGEALALRVWPVAPLLAAHEAHRLDLAYQLPHELALLVQGKERLRHTVLPA